MSKANTKQRIMDVTLALFNQLGAPNTSTNHVAIELDISPGNLYYHYKNKEKLIEQLFEHYEQELAPLLNQAIAEELSLEDIWFFLHFSFELSLKYRFVYQDTDYIILKCPSLARKFQVLLKRLHGSLFALLKQLSSNGSMTTDSELLLEELALNMLLISTQWIGFKQHFEGPGKSELTGDDLSQGVYQVLSLLLPYLDPAHQAHLYALREEYR